MRPGRFGRLRHGDTLVLVLAAFVVAYLVAGPLVISIIATFREAGTLPLESGAAFTLTNYVEAFTDARTWSLMSNTLLFALGSLALGTGLAITFAWLVERTDMPGRNIAYAMIVGPMAIPGMLAAIAWIFILDPRIGVLNLVLRWLPGVDGPTGPFTIYSLYGMILVEGLRMTPSIFLMISASFRSMDPSLEEASRACGKSTFETVRFVTVPLMWPAILAAMLYYFIVVVEAFEVPGVLGMSAGRHVFSTAVYRAVHPESGGLPDYGMASTLGLVVVAMAVLALSLYRRATRHARNFVTITGKGYRPGRLPLGRWRVPAMVLCGAYFALALVLPLAILLWSSIQPFYSPPTLEKLSSASLDHYRTLMSRDTIGLAARNTVVLAVVTATATMLIALVVGWLSVRSRSRLARLVDSMTFVPHAIASIVFALGVLLVYSSFRNPVYGTVYLIAVALTARYLAYTTRIASAGVLQLDPSLEEASMVSGGGWFRTYRRIVLPLLVPVFMNGWIWVAVHAARELSAALMLYSPDSVVVSTMVWGLWEAGSSGVAAALGVVLIVVLVTSTWLGRVVFTRGDVH